MHLAVNVLLILIADLKAQNVTQENAPMLLMANAVLIQSVQVASVLQESVSRSKRFWNLS